MTHGPDGELQYALVAMGRHRVRHMLVVKIGHLCGIFSIGDVVKRSLAETETEARIARAAFVIAR